MTSSCHFQKECRYSLQHICHKLRAVACSANIGLLLRHAGRSVTEIKREAMVTRKKCSSRHSQEKKREMKVK